MYKLRTVDQNGTEFTHSELFETPWEAANAAVAHRWIYGSERTTLAMEREVTTGQPFAPYGVIEIVFEA